MITKVQLPFSFLKSLHSGKITQFGHDLSFEIMLPMFMKTWFDFFSIFEGHVTQHIFPLCL